MTEQDTNGQAKPDTIRCPKCGHENPLTAYFCITCHTILIHRCPNCWHEQRQGSVCDNCGTNFALYWELQVERTMEEENRIWWDKLIAGAATFFQFISLPFCGVTATLRALVLRSLFGRLSNR